MNVPQVQLTIRPAGEADLAPFFVYLDDHLRDNGAHGAPLFQPLPRAQSRLPGGVRLSFIKGMEIEVGQPGWRRLWLALGPTGDIAGHVDLRSRPEAAAPHRALLGMGVHRAYRRRGLGAVLVDTAIAWARGEPSLAWIDLEVLAVNLPARELYLRTGFAVTGQVGDMLRIDGEPHGLVYMTRALR